VSAGLTDHNAVPAAATPDRVAVARAVAAAVTRVPGVARLSAGSVVESATHHAGGKIVGVTVDHQAVAVRVVAAQFPLPALADRVRAAVAAALTGLGVTRRVDIMIDDVDIDRLPAGPEGGGGR
jgi:hypothetical protein